MPVPGDWPVHWYRHCVVIVDELRSLRGHALMKQGGIVSGRLWSKTDGIFRGFRQSLLPSRGRSHACALNGIDNGKQ